MEIAQASIGGRRGYRVKRPIHDGDKVLNCLRKLVAWVGIAEVFPAERSSSAWKAAGETVYAPEDIVRR